MFRQAVYRKVVGPGTSPTAGFHALAGIISPPDFDHRSQLQRLPLAPVAPIAMSSPPRLPGLADIVWIARQARPDPAFLRFNQRAPLAQVDPPVIGFAPTPRAYLDFYKPTWSAAYWSQFRTQVVAELAAPTGGGPRRVYRWTPIQNVVTVAHEFTADDWLVAAIVAGLTPVEAALLFARLTEDRDG